MLKLCRLKSRSLLFTFDHVPEWNLNIHLILGDQHNYLIDTGLGTGSIAPVMQYLKPDKPVIVINTHYHWDHVWGNCAFKEGIIIANRLCYERLEKEWDNEMRANRKYIAGTAAKYLPNLVFDESLYFPKDGIRLLYTPGHTKDSISVIDEREGVINIGDNVGDNMAHIVPELECDQKIYADTLKMYISMNADICVSGHNVLLKPYIFGEILEKLR